MTERAEDLRPSEARQLRVLRVGSRVRMLRMPASPPDWWGYRGGDYKLHRRASPVRDLNAHVWAEAWDRSSRAWIRSDPTPTALEDEADAAVPPGGGWGEFWDYLDYQWKPLFRGLAAQASRRNGVGGAALS